MKFEGSDAIKEVSDLCGKEKFFIWTDSLEVKKLFIHAIILTEAGIEIAAHRGYDPKNKGLVIQFTYSPNLCHDTREEATIALRRMALEKIGDGKDRGFFGD